MKNLLIIFALAALVLIRGVEAHGQTAQPSPAATQTTAAGITPNRVIGEVTTIDGASNRMTVKTDEGKSVVVNLSDKTIYMRLAPGEKTLENAIKITLGDVGVGDRVLALGKVAEDQQSVPALRLIVMTKADIAQKQEHDRAEWRRRGIAGVVSALNPETKEITLSSRGRETVQPVIIPAAGGVRFRRYAPDSVNFSDAKPSSFAELKVGDQLRALGERSTDGARFTPEEVVSGAFRTTGGTITSINAAANELQLKDIQSNQTFTIVVSPDSLLRRLTPEITARLAQRGGRGDGAAATDASGQRQQRPSGAQEPSPDREQRRAERGGRAQEGERPGGARPDGERPRRGGGGFDLQEILERLPALTIADLKTGDMIIVSSTMGAEASRLTAIKLVAGVEELLNSPQGRERGQRGSAGGGLGLEGPDGGGIDFGIGLP